MKHSTTAKFRSCLGQLPAPIRDLANKNFSLLKQHRNHPSLNFKKVGNDLWSARVGIRHRALALEQDGDFVWIWIGSHAEYDKLLK